MYNYIVKVSRCVDDDVGIGGEYIVETLDFKGDFGTENAKLDGIEFRVNKHVDIIDGILGNLSTAWVDKDSAKYIIGWHKNCNEIKSLVTKAIEGAKSDLDEIAGILNR